MALQTLGLRFDAEPDNPDYPVVTVLVDGRDFLSGTRRADWVGFDPGQMLGQDSPLLPIAPARRVAVYRCCCGEAGCGCVAPIISRVGEHVLWSDARNFTGVYVGPSVDEPPYGGTKLDLPDLRFDADQYLAEVRRAGADNSWETNSRAAARLLNEYLNGEAHHLQRLGYTFEWATLFRRDGAGFHVSLRDPERRQVVVELRASDQPPADRAAQLAEQLLRSNPEDWHVIFRGDPPELMG